MLLSRRCSSRNVVMIQHSLIAKVEIYLSKDETHSSSPTHFNSFATKFSVFQFKNELVKVFENFALFEQKIIFFEYCFN